MHRIGREELASGRKYRIYMECRNSKSTNQRNCVQSIHPHLYRMWIYVSSECTGRTYKSRADPGSSGRNLITSVSLQRSLLPEEMPVYQIPIYQTLQIANMRLERKENALYYAQKGVVLCDLFSAGQNAQLNGLIQDSKTCFSNISIKMYLLHPARQKEGAFLPALPEIAGEKLSRKNPLFSWKRGL